jgi:sugar/nucleoside kinase (ribokinase family)
VLRRARAAGLRTSIDCVSEDSDRFRGIVLPVLPHVDIMFTNDFEAEKLTGLHLHRDNALQVAAVVKAAEMLLAAGVQSWVVIHFPEAVYARERGGASLWQPSLKVPPEQIAGAAGAGDALAAGVLFGLQEDWAMAQCLKLGVAAAAACRFDPSCSAGILSVAESNALAERLGYRPLPAI